MITFILVNAYYKFHKIQVKNRIISGNKYIVAVRSNPKNKKFQEINHEK